MRVLVCGGRNFTDRQFIWDYLNTLKDVECIIEGDARGADRLAGEWARHNGIPNYKYPADWTRHGKAAGPIRNTEMLRAFPGGTGTNDMVTKARAAEVRVVWVLYAKETKAETSGD
jgi:hypothetical protein